MIRPLLLTLTACGGPTKPTDPPPTDSVSMGVVSETSDTASDTSTSPSTHSSTSLDTGSPPNTTPASLSALVWSCPDPVHFMVEFWTEPTAPSSVRLNLWDVIPGGGGWNEEHPGIRPFENDGKTNWSSLFYLEDGASPQTFLPGQSTVFICGTYDTGEGIVLVVRTYDSDGVLTDCGASGNDPARVIDVLSAPSGGGDVPSLNPVTDPEEIDPKNCILF